MHVVPAATEQRFPALPLYPSMSILLPALLCGATWILWRFFRPYAAKSPLDNLPGPARTSFLRGNLGDLFNRHGWDFHDRIAAEYAAVTRYHGMFGTRGLYVSDAKAMHHIVVKDQHVYEEPTWFLAWLGIAFGPSLLSSMGEEHRKQRKLLNPVFSNANTRDLTPIFYSTIHRLRMAVEKQVGDTTAEVDVLNWMGRTALELIGQGGLGYSFDPLTEDSRNVFGDAIKTFIPLTFALHYYRLLYPKVRNIGSPAFRSAVVKLIPSKNLRALRALVSTMQTQARLIFDGKKRALAEGNKAVMHQIGEGKDIMSILMKANMDAKGEDKLPESHVVGQMSALVTAATDTTSNALSRLFHLLAQHQDIQDRVRAELLEASINGADIPYDTLVELPWLDAICRESLRLYAPVTMVSREVREDIVLPFAEPIRGLDGSMLDEVLVPKDTTIIVGIRACNRNKAIWGDDVLEWKPERWINGLPASVTAARVPGLYSNLMTFLGGGRACIGFKFSQLEMKVALSVMLRAFRFHLSDKEIYWNLAGVNYPTIGKESNRPAMILRLEPLKH
ncbi:cytochrome P450 [Trametopsis cervina]|nr:cytochrome P450 [Trametopsis cervina]